MKKQLIAGAVLLGVLLIAGAGFGYYKFVLHKNDVTPQEAKEIALSFISENLVQAGAEVEIGEVILEGELYKIPVNLGGEEIISYLSKDGKNFFPQAMNIEEVKKESAAQKEAENVPAAEIPKADVPQVELFVMSYCPYGTQIEKGILPVVEALGSKIKFELKFVDYVMHDKKEMDENTRQWCIQKNEPAKFNAYLKCFLKEGKADACLKSNLVNASKITSCMSGADAQFKLTEKFNNKESWNGGQYPPYDVQKADNEKYSVQGSPTLVINGVEAKAGRDSKSLLGSICSGFNNAPAECAKELSAETPSPGFGEGTAASSGSASCGS